MPPARRQNILLSLEGYHHVSGSTGLPITISAPNVSNVGSNVSQGDMEVGTTATLPQGPCKKERNCCGLCKRWQVVRQQRCQRQGLECQNMRLIIVNEPGQPLVSGLTCC